MMSPSIAVVGLACEYPDARTPAQLWENVLASRRAFRRLPPERLRVEDYWSVDTEAADRTYSVEAALVEGYEFDRVAFRVAGASFRSADLAHWLALDVAARALGDAGLAEGAGLPRETTGVFLGNTLTGEFSRANVLRLRWPFARRVVDAAIRREGWAPEHREEFLAGLEESFKSPFPPVGEETLAGSLSNTIAGRVCNHFDLKGGGYTVDGACASSLLAVAHACASLASGDLDAALAGGVDLSLDPFELIGFARAGALARDEMRVYDARPAGFLPGEGCGVVVLMRLEDALAQGRRIVAVIRGWGISSDGRGGITRPEVDGQLLALRRAYRRAGFPIGTVSYFEGHGTGTAVGDAAELAALARAILESNESGESGLPAVIGSIKANIGHTKAAAGVAGLIKAALAVDTQILPPTTGCEWPHADLAGDRRPLRALKKGEPWPDGRTLRAGVSAMGFGGINVHVVLESIAEHDRRPLGPREQMLLNSPQDAELFLLEGYDADDLRRRVVELLEFAGQLSMAEQTDLAAHLAYSVTGSSARAAIVAGRRAELVAGLDRLRDRLDQHLETAPGAGEGGLVWTDDVADIFVGIGRPAPRIGFLFPGQGTAATLDGGAWSRRFPAVEELYQSAGFPASGDIRATEVAQPAIISASLAALTLLRHLGIEAEIAVGHSLGELAALHWAGAIDADALIRIAAARGRAMARLPGAIGAMAGLEASAVEVEALINGDPVVIAGFNSPRQTVISGPAGAVEVVMARARRSGWSATRLAVSHAFHSPLVAAAVPPLADALQLESIRSPRRPFVSSLTGARVTVDVDVPSLLLRQVTAPVRFVDAIAAADDGIDLWIETGPGRVLTDLVTEMVPAPVVASEAGGESLRGLLRAVGAAFSLGAPVCLSALFDGRFHRPFPILWRPRFFANPCERAPLPPADRCDEPRNKLASCSASIGMAEADVTALVDHSARISPHDPPTSAGSAEPVIEMVRRALAERAELPPWSVGDDSRLLGDLHLNSITVGQVVAELAVRLGAAIPVEPTSFASATVGEVAAALEELIRAGVGVRSGPDSGSIAGVAPWFRAFVPTLAERPRSHRPTVGSRGAWWVVAGADDPLANRLREVLPRTVGGHGVLVCLPSDPDERHVGLLLEGARQLTADPSVNRFVMVQHGGGAASFARTIHQEMPRVSVCVVDLPVNHAHAVEWIVAEASLASEFAEVHYDESGSRYEPVLRLRSWPEPSDEPVVGPADVLLVSGGGKGIGAECALALARETGVRLALLGRARPVADPVLAANLDRMRAAGVRLHYAEANVADPVVVRVAVRRAESELGPITGILHAAGVNSPCRLDGLDEAAFLRTLAPKLGGFRNLLAAVRPERLRLLVTFGSIIGRTGMVGEADYGIANEWVTREAERFRSEYPGCRCLALEWSVWSGVGMGDRLGRVDALARQGIDPIPPDAGVALFRRLVSAPASTAPLVVAGRFGIPPALPIEADELPLLRFLERPLVDYPAIELVVEVDLATEADPYLDEHVFRGERLFPAVMGLEAMAQVAMAVLRVDEPPVFEDVTFGHPVVAPAGKKATIRLAAQVTAPNRVEVVLRSAATGFHLDHFRAICRFETVTVGLREDRSWPGDRSDGEPRIDLDPHCGLYGQLFFQAGRFRRLARYRRLRSTACEADIHGAVPRPWFHHHWPGRLVLGDPAARDAVIHAVQACIPQATILPVGVDRMIPWTGFGTAPSRVVARERSDLGDLLHYDVDVVDDRGEIRERWEGLHLRVVERQEPRSDWPTALLGPYLERHLRGILPGVPPITIAVERVESVPRRTRSDRLFQQLLGPGASVSRRADGKPETDGGRTLTAAHAGDWTVAAASPGVIACDLQPVAQRPAATWLDMLGPDRADLAGLVARIIGESSDEAATRTWVAGECLIKAGAFSRAPLTLVPPANGRAVIFHSGAFAIATLPLPNGPEPDRPPLILGFLVRREI